MRYSAHDYASGAGYFLTFNTAGRRRILSRIDQGALQLSEEGFIVHKHWLNLPVHYPRVVLDAMCIMPDHVHAIVFMTDARFARPELEADCKENQVNLSEVVRAWKSFSALEINRLRSSSGQRVWQRGFMERVIRDDSELDKFRTYIVGNPLRVELKRS
jgi:REP element-mobilizing transposase RayT